jgi:hypothetical protein
MATVPSSATTSLVENSAALPPAQRKVTLGPANVVAYMFQGTGVFMCLGKESKSCPNTIGGGSYHHWHGLWIMESGKQTSVSS